jgi:hypothetical protein
VLLFSFIVKWEIGNILELINYLKMPVDLFNQDLNSMNLFVIGIVYLDVTNQPAQNIFLSGPMNI